MNQAIKEIIKHEIQTILKENKKSELISKIRQEAIENDITMWFVNKFDKGLPNDETRAAVIEFGTTRDIYHYAFYVDESPRDDTRNAVLTDSNYSYYYARTVDRIPRDDTRNAVLSSPSDSYDYARFVDKGPHDDTRNAAWKNKNVGELYDKHFNITEPPSGIRQ